jgi:hypothetical protein
MAKSIEATIDSNGVVHLQEPLHLTGNKKAIVIIFDEELPQKEFEEKRNHSIPSWVGKYSSDGAMKDDRGNIYI